MACVQCNEGKYLDDDANDETEHDETGDCDVCPAGRYADETGLGECVACPAGSHLDDPGTSKALHDALSDCSTCGPGFYQETPGSQNCDGCPAGRYNDHGGGGTFDELTALWHNELEDCVICPAGQYQGSTGDTSCHSCPAGKYLSDDATSALAHDSLARCAECPAGSYSGEGAASCTTCPAGTSQANVGRTECEICAAGSYQTSTGQASCPPCPAGTFLDDEGTDVSAHDELGDCVDCGVDEYCAEPGGCSACVDCPTDEYASGGSSTCYTCDAGATADDCVVCSAGTYDTGATPTVCEPCPVPRPGGELDGAPGRRIGRPGRGERGIDRSHRPVRAQVGTASSADAATECAPCGEGLYARRAAISPTRRGERPRPRRG